MALMILFSMKKRDKVMADQVKENIAVETAALLFWSGHLFYEDKRQVYGGLT